MEECSNKQEVTDAHMVAKLQQDILFAIVKENGIGICVMWDYWSKTQPATPWLLEPSHQANAAVTMTIKIVLGITTK